MKQLRLPGLPRPPKPTVCRPDVALRIAERIVKAVNSDDWPWPTSDIPYRVADVQREIVRAADPATVFDRLSRRHQAGIYGWESIDHCCRRIADGIAAEELEAAVQAWRENRPVKLP